LNNVQQRVTVVMPVYNDWESFFRLVPQLDAAFADVDVPISIVAVDDGSEASNYLEFAHRLQLSRIGEITALHLVCNVGHQRAIAIGLADVARRRECDLVLVMDSDGEDRPEDARVLVEAALGEREAAFFVGQRRKRSESVAFKVSYQLYKRVFRLLTGKTIDFGNFSAATIDGITKLVYSPHCWNHFAAAVLRSGIPVRRIRTDRGDRLGGRSSMNFTALILLGLSAMSVYSEIVLVRVLVAALGCSLVAFVAFVGVVLIRIFSNLAIPGWTSTVGGLLILLLFQALAVSAGTAFQILGDRSRPLVVPAIDANQFILGREGLYAAPRVAV